MQQTDREVLHCIPLDEFFSMIPSELLKRFTAIYGYKDQEVQGGNCLELPLCWACEHICTSQEYVTIADMEKELYWDDLYEFAEEAVAFSNNSNTDLIVHSNEALMVFVTTLWYMYTALYGVIIHHQYPSEIFKYAEIQRWTTYSVYLKIGFADGTTTERRNSYPTHSPFSR